MNMTIEASLIALWTYRAGAAVLVLASFCVIGALLRKSIELTWTHVPLGSISHLLAGTAKFASLAVGLIVALGTLGVDVSALVAGLGLTGFAVGFALRDVIANLLAGGLILVFQPFALNQRIKVAGFEGYVASIDLRYTKLHSADSDVLIPNSRIFTDPVTIMK